jgi:hypothetical protein
MFGILFGLVLTIGMVSAEFWACFDKGEFIDYCNPAIPDRTAPNDGYTLCMSDYHDDCWVSGSYPVCLTLPLDCDGVGGNGTIDEEPPILDILSPIQDFVYPSKNILLEIESSEQADIFYQYAGESSWKNVCSNCWSYDSNRNFKEGLNELTFRSTDNAGNENLQELQFRVDSQEPQIQNVEPTSGFASGDFFIEFREGNPTEMKLHYGNDNLGFVDHMVDIENDCVQDDDEYSCTTSVDLSVYDNNDIEYYVELRDIAGNVDTSNTEDISVDYSNPVIILFEYEVDGKYVTFFMEVEETNFDKVQYYDHSASSPKWKNLCTSLDDDTCEKKVSFLDGTHDVDVRAIDEAENEAISSTTFFTDSKVPKIKEVEPSGDFASRYFEIEFDEQNPDSVILHYGNDESGFGEMNVDVGNDCAVDEDEHYCVVEADLSIYDGEEIEYWFVVKDLADQEDIEGQDELMVDISDPVIDYFGYVIDGKYATFIVDITEANFDEVMYIDNLADKPRWRKLCSKLNEGSCGKKVSFKDGEHDVDIQVYDKAGNSVGTSEMFLTDSKKPKILDMVPDGDFASGIFEIEIREINLESVIINYGNEDTGFLEHDVNIIDECSLIEDDEFLCSLFLELGSFENQEIEYRVDVFDIVDQHDEDDEKGLHVDTVNPVINSFDYSIDGDDVTFVLDITEANFDEVEYYDNLALNPKWRRLCSSLDEGICEKEVDFSDGNHDVDIRVVDEAGNEAFEDLEFTI